MASHYDLTIIGGGILGLATALKITAAYPRLRLLLLEKEPELARHQTGNNSGVIHSGLYYRPGSLKARACVAGRKELIEFCDDNAVPYEICGKVVVATTREELPRLEELHRRGEANGLQGLEIIGPERLKELEPHATGIKGLHVPETGIIDYKKVAAAYAEKIRDSGGDIRLSHKSRRHNRAPRRNRAADFWWGLSHQAFDQLLRPAIRLDRTDDGRKSSSRRAGASHHSVSWRVLQNRARTAVLGEKSDLSGSRSDFPVLGRSLHAHGQRRRRGRTQRGARLCARRLQAQPRSI